MDLRELPAGVVARHPWERARAQFFRRVLADAGLLSAPCRMLDLGAGDGYVASRLLERLPAGCSVACVDKGYTDDLIARFASGAPPGLTFARRRPDERFDMVLLLDVLEHVPDDSGFLREIVESALAPTGSVLVSVPAFGWLFTRRDRLLGHYRRYTRSSLQGVLGPSRLSVRRSGGLFHSLLLLRAAQKLVEQARGLHNTPGDPGLPPFVNTELGRWRAGAFVTTVVQALLAGDIACSRLASRIGLYVPGMSVWALGTLQEKG